MSDRPCECIPTCPEIESRDAECVRWKALYDKMLERKNRMWAKALEQEKRIAKMEAHMAKCPEGVQRIQLEARVQFLQELCENHRQSLAGISDMDPKTEAYRMRQWAKDAIAGYVESAEVTIKHVITRAEKAEARVKELETLTGGEHGHAK